MIEPAYPRPYGSYTLLERLGAGGMSEVDLARKTAGEASFVRFLVIKRIRAGNNVDEQYVRMFQDEARINAELSHENIAQVYDFGREADEFYMAMEYVPGLDLRAVQIALARRGKLLPVRIALTILCGVLRALQYAHTRVDQLGRPMNIVHRDVNPRNIMLSVNGEVKLIDFGVAKAADRLEKTEGNTVKGKFAYMAPEQIDGNAAVDARADLFAVALVFHELLTGRSPFAGLGEVQILHRILSGKIPALPDGLDHPDITTLRRIHARGLAIRASDRYPNADAFRADIEAALSPIGGVAPPLWIAELLREAAGDGVADITRRLRSYRDGVGTGPRAPIPAPPPVSEASGTLNVASIEAPPGRPTWLAWAAAGLGISGVGFIGLALVGAVVTWWLWSRPAEPEYVRYIPPDTPAEGPPDAPAAPGSTPIDAAVAPAPEAHARAASKPVAAPPAGAPSATSPPSASSPSSPPATAAGSTAANPWGAPATTSGAAASSPAMGSPPAEPSTASVASVAPASAPTAPASTAPAATTPASTTQAATIPASTTQAAASRVPHGFLNLTSRPVKLDVYIDGAKVGVTPLRLHRLPAGSHEVTVRDAVTGRSETRSVVVGADAVVTSPPVLLE